MYKKLNYLASSLAPDYGGNGYMKGNLVELTIGGYIINQPGFITSMNLSIMDDTPFEIAINDEGDKDPTLAELPMIIRVDNFQFIPIHNFIPALQTNTYGDENSELGDVYSYGEERFIALSSDGAKESLYGDSSLGSALQMKRDANQERQRQAQKAKEKKEFEEEF